MIDIATIYKPVRSDGTETLMSATLIERIESADPPQRLNLAPDYQRGYVWTDRQASQFVGHMIEGGHVGPVIVQRFPLRGAPLQADEVIDGQQRLRSFYRWLTGDIHAELFDGTRLRVGDLEPKSRALVRSYWLTGPHFTVMYVSLPRRERLELYLRLNRGGTVHTDAEIERVFAMLEAEKSR